MGITVSARKTCSPTGNHLQHHVCYCSPRCLPAGPWPPCAPCAPPPRPCTPPPPRLTLTPLLSSSELELTPLELLDLEQELAPSSDLSSSATPGILPLSNSFSHTPFWDSLCPRPWVSSA